MMAGERLAGFALIPQFAAWGTSKVRCADSTEEQPSKSVSTYHSTWPELTRASAEVSVVVVMAVNAAPSMAVQRR